MRTFNLAEELEKERKKNKELKADLKEANESITWWTNRFNAVERDNREIQNRIDKAVEYIELGLANEEEAEELLDILEGDNK